jgi:hypothetical protein
VYDRTERSWRGLTALQTYFGRGGAPGVPPDVYGPTSFSDNVFDRTHDLLGLYFTVTSQKDLLAERFGAAVDALPFAGPDWVERMREIEDELGALARMLQERARAFEEMSREINAVRRQVLARCEERGNDTAG